jgi:hypothetical protein
LSNFLNTAGNFPLPIGRCIYRIYTELFCKQAATCCFSKDFCENLGEKCQPMGEKIKIQKRIVYALPVLKRVLQIVKILVLSG